MDNSFKILSLDNIYHVISAKLYLPVHNDVKALAIKYIKVLNHQVKFNN